MNFTHEKNEAGKHACVNSSGHSTALMSSQTSVLPSGKHSKISIFLIINILTKIFVETAEYHGKYVIFESNILNSNSP